MAGKMPTARGLLNRQSYETWPRAAIALAARVEKLLAGCDDVMRHTDPSHLAIVGVEWILRVLNGEEP